MRLPTSSLFASSLLVAFFTVSAASAAGAENDAQATKAPKADADTSGAHLSGLEVMLRPGFGAGGSASPVQYHDSTTATVPAGSVSGLVKNASPYGAGFIGDAFIGYRFHPVISGGLRGGIRTVSAPSSLSPNDGTSGISRSAWDAGFYVRGYPLALSEGLRKYVDPWISLGVVYMSDSQAYQGPVIAVNSAGATQTISGSYTIDHHAVAIPIGLGVDYRVLPMLSVGPSFEYTIATAIAGCWAVSAAGLDGHNYCTNSEPGKQILTASSYGVWTIGLDIKLTPF